MTQPSSLKQIQAVIAEKLSPKRYQHTIAVMQQAQLLADQHGANSAQGALASLLHDCTKEWTYEKQLKTIENSATINIEEKVEILSSSSDLFHAVTGTLVARENFSVTDFDVLNSIRYHTTARAGMSLLEKIVYVADKTSIDRTYQEAATYRALAFASLDRCLFLLIRDIIRLLAKREQSLPKNTIAAYHAYQIHPSDLNTKGRTPYDCS